MCYKTLCIIQNLTSSISILDTLSNYVKHSKTRPPITLRQQIFQNTSENDTFLQKVILQPFYNCKSCPFLPTNPPALHSQSCEENQDGYSLTPPIPSYCQLCDAILRQGKILVVRNTVQGKTCILLTTYLMRPGFTLLKVPLVDIGTGLYTK